MKKWMVLFIFTSLLLTSGHGAISGIDLERLAPSVVEIVPLSGSDKPGESIGTSGSGTIVTVGSIKYIVTNHHVVYNTDTRKLARFSQILVTKSLESPPEASFVFETILADSRTDLAILRYVERWKGSALDIATLPSFTFGNPKSIGSSVDLHLNDDIIILGYPGYDFGGRKPVTLTITNGKVSGFMEDKSVSGLTRAWIKTDALVSWGNSGGLVIDASGRFIGIPTEVSLDPEGGRIALLRPVDLLRPFFDYVAANPKAKAVGVAGWTGKLPPVAVAAAPPSSGGKPSATPVPTPSRTAASPVVSKVIFATYMKPDGTPIKPGNAFASADSRQLIAFFDFSGFSDGSKYDYLWYRNGKQISSESVVWELGESGSTYVTYLGPDGKLPVGSYKLSISIKGKKISENAASITDNRQVKESSSRTTAALSGSVVDAATKRPVAGAIVAFIKPEFTAAQFIAKQDESMLASLVQPDSKGFFKTDETLVAGTTYAMVAVARGYEPWILSPGITVQVRASDNQSIKIELKRSK